MKPTAPSTAALRVSELAQNTATPFALRPEKARLEAIAADLQLLGLRKLSFNGEVKALGDVDWILRGSLGATVVQPCAVSLEPVTSRIDTPVTRVFQRDFADEDAPEAEMPEDDSIEPLGLWIDPDAVMIEALVLHLPLYPRAEGAELGETILTEPGVAPMRDEDARPFAGLAALKGQLGKPPKSDDET
ncbi:MAG: DUF177 domain-containing protein [Roseobacter sp.]